MHKKDYIAQVMAIYKQIEYSGQDPGSEFEIRLREPERGWHELVNEASLNGMENMDVNDLVRMADYAKEILR